MASIEQAVFWHWLQACAVCPGCNAAWRLDEARLVWQSGQQKAAARMARSLADAMLGLQAHARSSAGACTERHTI